jgi:hypothetical protein
MGDEPPVPLLRNPISLTGAAIATIAALLFLVSFLVDLVAVHSNPYIDLLFFVLLPALFVLGLLLMPLGVWREQRRRVRGLSPSFGQWPRFDLNHPTTRRIAFAIIILTPVNIALLALASVKGVEAMDTNEFCGAVCHTVMEPEYVAHAAGPHHQVHCTTCHVGAGARGFLRAKINGTRQLYLIATGGYRAPVPTPVHGLNAEMSCVRCHATRRWSTDRERVFREFADDETNTESATTVRLHLGGVGGDGVARGIHWHASADVEYVAADETRQTIPWVSVRRPDGSVTEYFAEGTTAVPPGERRRMDCLDCHSRPAHSFGRSADRSLNEAIASGEVPRSVPFVKREALKVLSASHPTQAEGLSRIATDLTAFYRQQVPAATAEQQAAIARAIAGTQAIYRRSVFPSMKVTFGVHPDNRGHTDFTGCFRCHDDSHKAKDGRVIKMDCDSCHEVS